MEVTDFAKYIGRFLSKHLPHERNVSPNTVSSYRDSFVSFLEFLSSVKKKRIEHVTLNDLNRDNVVQFLSWLIDTKRCAISTRNSRLAAIHSFVLYLQFECVERIDQWQNILTIKNMKKERPVPTHYSRDGVKAILGEPDSEEYNGIRHLAILEVMYDTGCRVQELVDLTVGSLRVQTSPYTIKIMGKGRKVRIVPLSEPVVKTIRKYIERYRIDLSVDAKSPLFKNKYGRKLTRAGVTYILQKYASTVKKEHPELMPDRISCHQMRHSRAMNLQEEGVDLVWIRDLLGHVSVQTTEIYARTSSKQKNEAIEKASESLNPNPEINSWNNNKSLLSWLKSLGK